MPREADNVLAGADSGKVRATWMAPAATSGRGHWPSASMPCSTARINREKNSGESVDHHPSVNSGTGNGSEQSPCWTTGCATRMGDSDWLRKVLPTL